MGLCRECMADADYAVVGNPSVDGVADPRLGFGVGAGDVCDRCGRDPGGYD